MGEMSGNVLGVSRVLAGGVAIFFSEKDVEEDCRGVSLFRSRFRNIRLSLCMQRL